MASLDSASICGRRVFTVLECGHLNVQRGRAHVCVHVCVFVQARTCVACVHMGVGCCTCVLCARGVCMLLAHVCRACTHVHRWVRVRFPRTFSGTSLHASWAPWLFVGTGRHVMSQSGREPRPAQPSPRGVSQCKEKRNKTKTGRQRRRENGAKKHLSRQHDLHALRRLTSAPRCRHEETWGRSLSLPSTSVWSV